MSVIKTITKQQDNQLNVDYLKQNLLRGNNAMASGNVTASGADVDLTMGEVMGRISATGLLTPLAHDASDGSQYPAGLAYMGINVTKTVVDGTTKAIEVVYQGNVDANLISFAGVTTLDDVVSGRRVSDWLRDLGLVLDFPQEQTGHANP